MTTMRVDTETGEIKGAPEAEGNQLPHFLTLLNAAATYKTERDNADKAYKVLMGTPAKPGPLRRYWQEHLDDDLRDGETGVFLKATPKNTGARADLMTMARDCPNILLKLAELGFLKLDMTLWKKHPKDFIEAEDAKRFIMPGGVEYALSVEKE